MSNIPALTEEQARKLDLLAEKALDAIAKRDAKRREAARAQTDCEAAWGALVDHADSVVPVTRSSRSVVEDAMRRAKARVAELASQTVTEGPIMSVAEAVAQVVSGRKS